MRHIFNAVSAVSILFLSATVTANPSQQRQPESTERFDSSARTYVVGDTIYVADGDPLPEAPEGTEWVATGLMIETFPVLHEYVLTAVSQIPPVESPSVLTLMVGELLPDPPTGMDYVLTALLETYPAQYRFELAPGNPSFSTFSGFFNVIGAFAQGPAIAEHDAQFLIDLALEDGELQGHERQALWDSLLVLEPLLTPEAKALLENFLKEN